MNDKVVEALMVAIFMSGDRDMSPTQARRLAKSIIENTK